LNIKIRVQGVNLEGYLGGAIQVGITHSVIINTELVDTIYVWQFKLCLEESS